ncbi:MAG: hypothetical protein ACP5RG_06435 [Thermoplasmata archaeon]
MIKNLNIPSEKTRFHSGRKKHRNIEDPYVQDVKRDRLFHSLRKEIIRKGHNHKARPIENPGGESA